jgi:hypothetical protein
MQKETVATSSNKIIWIWTGFMFFMGAGTLFFLMSFVISIKENKIGGMIASGLLFIAGAWQTYRIYQNIKLRDGVLTIDSEKVTWNSKGKTEVALLSEVHQLSSWCGFTVLKNSDGKKLMSFPENRKNYNKILENLIKHIHNE